jgi:hypothetical protein
VAELVRADRQRESGGGDEDDRDPAGLDDDGFSGLMGDLTWRS